MRAVYWILFGVVLCSSGCATRAPIELWQSRVEHYVEHEGRGDPNVLRLLPVLRSPAELRSAPITLGALNAPAEGIPPFGPVRDIFGSLVDVREINGETWFIFIVGVVRYESGLASPDRARPVIEDVRAAAMCRRGWDELTWRIGAGDEAALARYTRSAALASDAGHRHVQYTFPSPNDRFELSLEGSHVRVREVRSGAAWVVSLDRRDYGHGSRPDEVATAGGRGEPGLLQSR